MAGVTPATLLRILNFARRTGFSAERSDVVADGAADAGPYLVALPDIFERASPCATKLARGCLSDAPADGVQMKPTRPRWTLLLVSVDRTA